MELNYHFDTETFRVSWQEWKTYRKVIKKKPIIDEQRALNQIFKLSNGNEQVAFCIMERSMDNEYQGLFPLPINYQMTSSNGKSTNAGTTAPPTNRTAQSYFDKINRANCK